MFKLCARQINPSTYKEMIKNEMRCRDDMPKQYEDAGTGLCVITFTSVSSLVTFGMLSLHLISFLIVSL